LFSILASNIFGVREIYGTKVLSSLIGDRRAILFPIIGYGLESNILSL